MIDKRPRIYKLLAFHIRHRELLDHKNIPPINPELAAPMCESTSMIFSTDDGSNNLEVNRFSTARIIPWVVLIPTAVEPNLTASIAYST